MFISFVLVTIINFGIFHRSTIQINHSSEDIVTSESSDEYNLQSNMESSNSVEKLDVFKINN